MSAGVRLLGGPFDELIAEPLTNPALALTIVKFEALDAWAIPETLEEDLDMARRDLRVGEYAPWADWEDEDDRPIYRWTGWT